MKPYYLQAMWTGVQLLIHRPGRLSAAVAGVAVAVVIMFVEMGFFYGVIDSQAHLAELVRGDLVVLNHQRTNLNKWTRMERIRLQQVSALPGVVEVVPIYKGTMGLENPQSGAVKRIIVYAFRADAMPLALGPPAPLARALKQPGTLLFDSASRNIYGELQVGETVALDDRSYRVGGFITMGPNLVNDGAVVMSDGEWLKIHPDAEPVMGVVRLEPGAERSAIIEKITALEPGDMTTLTPGGLHEREILFTVRAAPIGVIFGVGMIAGLVIGISICYQILFNEVSDSTRQYATLKAMGFGNGFLRTMVAGQALLLAAAGFMLGIAISSWLYDLVAEQTALLMQFTAGRSLLVLGLAVVMCLAAAQLAIHRVGRSDPAELY